MPAKKSNAAKASAITKQQTAPNTDKKTNTISIFAIILTFLLFTIPIVGLVLGIIALVQINKRKEGGKGLAIASIVISSIFIVLQIIFAVALFAFANFGNDLSSGKRSLNFSKDGNTLSIGSNVKIPSGFPSDVPVYPGSQVKLATKTNKDEFAITLTTKDGQDKVSQYYKEKLATNGWVAESESEQGEIGQKNPIGTYNKNNLKTNILVLQNQKADQTTIFLTVSPISQ